MLRIRAVQELLLEEIAGLRWPRDEEVSLDPKEALADLDRARRRALGVVLVAGLALLALLFTHPDPTRFLSFAGADKIFALVALTIAFVAGFRLGNWEKLRTVSRAVQELSERDSGEQD